MRAIAYILTTFLVLASLVSIEAYGQVIDPGQSTTVKCNTCAPCPVCPVCPTPAPTPVPTPKPTPVPTPAPIDPCAGYNKRVTPGALQAAQNAALPGDMICVTPGTLNGPVTFTRSGTADKLIRYKFLPGAVIKPGVGNANNQVRVDKAQYINIDGIAVNEAYAFKITKSQNITVQNCKVEHSRYSTMDIHDSSYIRIINCDISWGGYNADDKKWSPADLPKQEHGIYIANSKLAGCPNMTDISIIGGSIHDIGGRAVLIKGDDCPNSTINRVRVEGVDIYNVSYGILTWNRVFTSSFINNLISTFGYPETDDPAHHCFGFYSSNGNTVEGNTCKASTKGNACEGLVFNHYSTWSNNCINNIME